MEEKNPIAQQLLNQLMQFRSHFRPKPYEGLKPSEYKLLFTIKYAKKRHGAILTVSDLSKHLQVTAPSVTQIINRLETDGLVERRMDPSDRRSVRVHLTDEGEKATEIVLNAYYEKIEGFIEFLGEEKSKQFVELLTQMLGYFADGESNTKGNDWR